MPQALVTLWTTLTVSLPVLAFFALTGRAALKAAGVDEAALTLWLVAPAAGAACWSALSFFILSVAGFHASIIWAGIVVSLAAALFTLRGMWGGAVGWRSAAPIVIALRALAVLPILPLLPAFEDGGLYYGLAIFDHVKVALVDSIYREGLPPVSPYIAPDGKPAALFYYYGWYVLAAEIRAIFGCSGYIADVALSHVTAASSLALMCAIAYRLCGSRAAIGGVVLIASVADPEALLARLVGWPAVLKLKGDEWGIDNWLQQNFWAPQHVFAATAVVFAIVAVGWLCAPNAKTWRLAVVVAGAAAAAVTASIYAGAFVLAAIALPAAAILMWDMWATPSRFRIVAPLLMAVALAGLLSAPMIRNLASFGSGAPKILGFWIYPSLGFIEPTTVGGKIAHIVAFWLMLLPLRIGLVYVLGLWQLRRPQAKPHTPQFLFWALAVTTVVICLLVAQFVASTLERNDLGWKVILPAVLLLTAAAGALVGRWISELLTAQDRRARGGRWRAAVALLIVGAISLPLTVLGVRQAGEQFFLGGSGLDETQRHVHRVFAAQQAAWRDVQARTAPSDLVISNPTAFDDRPSWSSNLPWALFADRSSLLSSANWARLLSSQLRPSGIIGDYAQMLDRVFAGHSSPQDRDALAGPLKVRMIVVTPLDALWADDSSVTPRFARVAQGQDYRLYAPRDRD